jgi:hypothetical protein
MADQTHDIRDFFSTHKVPIATLLNEVRVDIVFLRLQNSGLMKTNTGGMYVHM